MCARSRTGGPATDSGSRARSRLRSRSSGAGRESIHRSHDRLRTGSTVGVFQIEARNLGLAAALRERGVLLLARSDPARRSPMSITPSRSTLATPKPTSIGAPPDRPSAIGPVPSATTSVPSLDPSPPGLRLAMPLQRTRDVRAGRRRAIIRSRGLPPSARRPRRVAGDRR